MKRAILLLASFACCGGIGCDSNSANILILTIGLNARAAGSASDNVVATSDGPAPVATSASSAPSAQRTPPVDELVAAMQELNSLQIGLNANEAELENLLAGLIDRIAASVGEFEQCLPASTVLVQQAREAQAIALVRVAESLPTKFSDRRDAYCQASFGRQWDGTTVEKQAINRLVSGYLVAPTTPSDAPNVLALHTVTFPDHPMNVELYTTIAERLVGEGNLLGGIELARAGLTYCGKHSDVGRLTDRVKRFYREHPGEIGVPMNFAGPTMREQRFTLSSLKGRPVLVVFWSTTEPASDEFMVNCNKLVKRYSATEVEVVGVSLNAKMEDLELWYFNHGFPCRHVFSAEKGHEGFENPIARFYRVTAVPQFFLLDRDGIVFARGEGELDKIENELRRIASPRLALTD